MPSLNLDPGYSTFFDLGVYSIVLGSFFLGHLGVFFGPLRGRKHYVGEACRFGQKTIHDDQRVKRPDPPLDNERGRRGSTGGQSIQSGDHEHGQARDHEESPERSAEAAPTEVRR